MSVFQEVNRKKLVRLLRSGGKDDQGLGIEMEHILLRRDGSPVAYDAPQGVRAILERLAPAYDHVDYEQGAIIGLARPGEVVSIEPAGQLEISIGPVHDVVEAEAAYLEFRDRLDPILDEFGIVTPMLGYNPAAKARDLPLVPKMRYTCMHRFLSAQSESAVRMMRGSAALQVSVDYTDEADALRKLRIAQILSPVLALICDNSPILEELESKGYTARTTVWSTMKHDRVGTIPGSLDPSYTFKDYADYILSREAILVPDRESTGSWRYEGARTFYEIYADTEMTEAEIEHAISMTWPDVRLRTFLEIRPADAVPLEYALAYVVLIRALFYSERNLAALEALVPQVSEQQIDEAKEQLAERGYGAVLYGKDAGFWADLLIVLASGEISEDEASYLEPLASMTRYRNTLANAWPRRMEKRSQFPAGTPDSPVIGVVPCYDFEWSGTHVNDDYISGLLESGAVPIVLPPTKDPEHLKRLVRACDGFLIPGGQDIDPARYGARRKPHTHRSATARDRMEQELIPLAIAEHKPILGICRGMQSLNVTLGGTLHQDINVEVPESVRSHVQGRPWDTPTHMLNLVEGSLLARTIGAPRIGVNSLHHQSVAELGDGLVASAISDDGVIEGIEMPGEDFVVGVQWHPERMWRRRPHSKRLFAALAAAAAEVRRKRT